VPLVVLGFVLTLILWWIAERDQEHRDLAFKETGLPETRPKGCFGARRLMRVVFILLLLADGYLVAWMYCPALHAR
jgi:hypothetical protein